MDASWLHILIVNIFGKGSQVSWLWCNGTIAHFTAVKKVVGSKHGIRPFKSANILNVFMVWKQISLSCVD